MNRNERIELDQAILEAARHIWAANHGEKLTFEEIHKIIKASIPSRFQGEVDWKSDWDAWYDAKERWIASREYKDTGKNTNIFMEGWNAARDYYQGRNPGDGQK